ncbi:MAG: todS 13 [Bacteroidetes bacterium]|nr:todS 13 [Bacteroidota bacterium]
MKKALLLILLFIIHQLSDAQVSSRKLMDQYNFSAITIKDGLLHNFIDDIYKDSRGFLWLSTQNGLSRYDGYSFTHYNISSNGVQLKNNFINQVCEDNFNRLWIVSEAGFEVLNLKTNILEVIDLSTFQTNELMQSAIYFVRKDHQGRIWLATQDNLFMLSFDKTGKLSKLTPLYSTYERHSAPITALKEINNEMWIGYNRDVYVVKEGSANKLSLKRAFAKQLFDATTRIHCFCKRDGDVWIGTNRGLYRYNLQNNKYRHYQFLEENPNSLSQSYITDLALTHKNELVVGTLKGLNFYDPLTDGFVRIIHTGQSSDKTINCNFINCLYSDGNIVWIGTEIGGLNKMINRNLQIQTYIHHPYDQSSLADNPVNAIFEDNRNNLWVGNVEGGLNLRKKGTDTFIHFTHQPGNPNSLSHNSVCAITQDNRNQLWIGTWGHGISVLNMDNLSPNASFKRYSTENSALKNDFVGTLAFDKLNDGIWVGTSEGLNFFDLKHQRFFNITLPTDKFSNNSMIGMLIDSKSRLWIGTRHGLIVINLFSFAKRRSDIRYRYMEYKLDNQETRLIEKINCIYEDRKGTIWLGSNGYGMYKLESDAKYPYIFSNMTTKSGLPDNTIFGILDDKAGNLWLSTNFGLSHYDTKSRNFTNYSEADGLLSDQFYWNAYCKSASGSLFFGCSNGMIGIEGVFKPSKVKKHKVVFTSLSILNENIVQGNNKYLKYNIAWAKKLSLHERDKSFSIEFSALNFENSDKLKYLYRLKGFDNNWIEADAKRHFASYTNLRAGKYTFEVKILNYLHPEASEVTELPIDVAPFFYKTWWFFLLVLFAIGLAAAYFYQRRIASYKEQGRILTEKVKERTLTLEEKMEVLSQQNELLTQQKKQLIELSKKIQEITADKISFFTNITHEFRTPITLIMGPIERALKLSNNPVVIEQLNIVERNSKSLLALVNQLLDFRKVESGKITITKRSNELLSFIDNLVLPFQAFAKERRIEIRKIIHLRHSHYYYDEEWIRKVLVNLLSNAVKFTPDGGSVTLYLYSYINREGVESLYIAVSDSGVGILEKDLTRIFDRFYQSRQHVKFPVYGQSGTGIGLYLCKRIVQQHGGSIYARNNHSQGASVRVILSLQPDYDIEQQELAAPINDPSPAECSDKLIVKEKEEINVGKKQEVPTILIVEDNTDMRIYVRSILSSEYHILEAGNGAEALIVLENNIVDFIVSDLMMPVMDGMEFSKRVKENLATSHIPLLILTAKISEEVRLESYRVGVDEYLQKPFDEELLIVRIRNIFNNRKQNQTRFALQLDPAVLQIDEESRDNKFMASILSVIEANYKNPDFEVSDFASAMGISKTLLNQKLQNLVGQPSVKLISTYRLKKAWELVQVNKVTKNLNISEIAYEVGFNDPKYFSRCFQKEFGMLPSSILSFQPNETDSFQ